MKTKIYLLLICYILPFILKAQEDSTGKVNTLLDFSMEELMNMEVVSASVSGQKLGNAPSTMLIITAQQIEERGYEELSDALRDVPGIGFIHLNGYVPTLIYFRGMYGAEILISYKIMQGAEFIGTVKLRSELTTYDEILINYIKVAASVLVGALLIAFLISTFFPQLITSRLLLLVNKAKEVSRTGNYSNRLYDRGTDEIGVLSKEFNNMLDQIQKMQNSLKEIMRIWKKEYWNVLQNWSGRIRNWSNLHT